MVAGYNEKKRRKLTFDYYFLIYFCTNVLILNVNNKIDLVLFEK